MFDVKGKNALITGATGGIGRAIAQKLHAAGAIVGISGTRQERLQDLAEMLGERVHVLPCNLSDLQAVDALAGEAVAAMGGIDIFVSNAGVTRDGLMMRMKNEDWDDVLRINLTAYARLARACLRGMAKKKHGRIIAITSVSGVMGNAGQTNYAASKAGMIGMSKSLAQEMAPRGITVNCVAPGFIETAMTDVLNDQQKQAIFQKIPAGVMGKPDDIAAAVLYLASQEAGYMTGQTLHVNGGMAMV